MKRRCNGEGTIYFDEKKKLWIGQKMINGKRKKVASKKQKELKEKMKNLDFSVDTSSITLIQLLEKNENEKFSANITSEGTFYRNTATLKLINNSSIANLKISKVTSNQLQDFLNSKLELSQSYIDKLYMALNNALKRAIKDNLLLKNPMINVECPISNKSVKKVIAFEVWEQKQLLDYILSNNLLGNSLSKYDNNTIKNLILLGLFTGMREGELGAIDYKKNINLNENLFEITRTLTRDKNGKIKIGNFTKTGKRKNKQGKVDSKIIPFSIYDENFVKNIVEEQIEVAENNKLNKNQVLFCRTDGNLIVSSEINNIFKRICRVAEIKLNLPTGCHFHMLRHTFATRCIEARLELLTIAKLLGHSDTKQIEKTYGHILDKFRNEELNNLQNYYKKNNIITIDRFKK